MLRSTQRSSERCEVSSLTEPEIIRNWLFKALTAEDRLDRLEQDGLAVRASSDPRALQRVIPLEDFSADIRRAAMSALPAYLAFYCLENSVRELTTARLAENHGDIWWDTCVPAAIRAKVDKRREAEGQNRWHVARGVDPIYYTDFGDLRAIIQSNWADFADLFPDQNWVLTKLGELEASRNIIAHMNPLDDRELERIALYLHDWSRQVG